VWKKVACYIACVLLILATQSSKSADSDWAVALDIGHTPSQPGAISSRGVPEYIFNQQMVTLLLQRLHQNGFPQAFVVNRDDPELSLEQRAEIANQLGADVFLSIHHDSVQKHYLETWLFQGDSQQYLTSRRTYPGRKSTAHPTIKRNLSI